MVLGGLPPSTIETLMLARVLAASAALLLFVPPALAADGWRSTGSLATARADHTASLLGGRHRAGGGGGPMDLSRGSCGEWEAWNGHPRTSSAPPGVGAMSWSSRPVKPAGE